jgi:hypothetical protein
LALRTAPPPTCAWPLVRPTMLTFVCMQWLESRNAVHQLGEPVQFAIK